MKLRTQFLVLIAAAALSARAAEREIDFRGGQFVGFDSLAEFSQANEPNRGQIVLTSPVISSRIHFNEVVVSWNAELPRDSYLIVEARAVYPKRNTKYYDLGHWSKEAARHLRQSVAGQTDSDGDVRTDVLVLRQPANRLQLRLTLGNADSAKGVIKFLGISFTDTNIPPSSLPPNHAAWGKLIPVLERSQMLYPNGKELCSPTTVSMLLSHWARTLNRPELDRPVPEVAEGIYDSQWKGTGNWPFNMAYAGSFPGMRAYVARLSDVSELEAWIVAGIPVGLSLDYDRLRGKGLGPEGHLVALVGFTTEGEPIINDPGTSEHVRKIFPHKNLIDAWACSRNTVYLVYPENVPPPEDAFRHWSSPEGRSVSADGK